MEAILVEKKYKYDKITLAYGKVVSASSVIIRRERYCLINGRV